MSFSDITGDFHLHTPNCILLLETPVKGDIYMKRKIVTALLSAMMLTFLTGCDALQPGLKKLADTPDTEDTVTVMAKNTVERLASQKHIPYSLSDDFIQRYLNMQSFDELKARTKAGIAATNSSADMTEAQYRLWQDIIATEQLNQYTVKDLEDKKIELNSIMDKMAADNNQSLEEFLEKYGMSLNDGDEFAQKQAEKYVQEDVENTSDNE